MEELPHRHEHAVRPYHGILGPAAINAMGLRNLQVLHLTPRPCIPIDDHEPSTAHTGHGSTSSAHPDEPLLRLRRQAPPPGW